MINGHYVSSSFIIIYILLTCAMPFLVSYALWSLHESMIKDMRRDMTVSSEACR